MFVKSTLLTVPRAEAKGRVQDFVCCEDAVMCVSLVESQTEAADMAPLTEGEAFHLLFIPVQ